ncbi:MAG: AraC family transcriptional regulator [Saprospiraceae bacterium]
MSISTLKKYRYLPPLDAVNNILFEVDTIQLETSCIANEDHRSENYQVFFLEEGEGRYQIDFHQFEIDGTGIFCLSPGQILTVESEAVKSGYRISFNREFYCVEVQGKVIGCNGILFNNTHRATFLQLEAGKTPVFHQLVENMIGELQHPGKAHLEILETYLRMFFIEVLRLQDETPPILSGCCEDNNRLAADFIALVDQHYRKIRTVSEYADMLHVAPKSLTKRLKEHGYKTPTEIIRDRIVLEAKRDLRYTQKSVKEIAFDLGFEDAAYFTRYFKKSEQESPLAYREAYVGGA